MICGNIFDPKLPHTCDRTIPDGKKSHTGKHHARGPSGTVLQWWGAGFKEPQHQPVRESV